MINMKERLQYISILRSISVLLVVFFHVYGYTYAEHFPETKDIYETTYYWINQCVVINIAMPLFTFISGYLFEYLYSEKGKYRDFLPFIKNKFDRLWIPFFVFGFVMMATTSNFHPLKLLEGGYWHLWYLPRLFWCFFIAWFINRYITKPHFRILLCPILLFYQLLGWNIPTFIGIQGVTNWLGYFYLGILIWDYKDIIHNVVGKFILIIPLFVVYIIISVHYPVEYGEGTWYSVIAAVSIVTCLWYLFISMNEKTIRFFKPLIWLSSYSFGIYIFHNWVGLYLVGHLSQKLFHLPELAANHVILFPLCLTSVDLIISTFLSWVLLKTKVGKKLIG